MTQSSTLATAEKEIRPGGSVLVAEDDPIFRKIIPTWLDKWGYAVTVVEDGAEAWKILQDDDPPQLVILDWMMPGIDGLELCRRIRQRQNCIYRYVLLVTAKSDKQDVVMGLEAGADDYLTKPFDRNELRARLRVGSRILELQHDLIAAREELRFQSTHDLLTATWNRTAVLDLFHSEFERMARAKTSLAVFMLDLDHFKNVNDTYGHLTGDVVLQEVASRITRCVRTYDLVGRYGGEEFLVVLPNCDEAQAQASAERLRRAVSARPISIGQSEISVSLSVGVATTAAAVKSEKELLLSADAALYQAKNAGRDRVVVSVGSTQRDPSATKE